MQVPFVNLRAQYASSRKEIARAIEAVCEEQQFILGPRVQQLEERLAVFTKTASAIGVSSGTDALVVTMMALGIGPGDAVVTSPYTFFSTASSISRLGATPVFVDIDPRSYMIDPARVADQIKAPRPNSRLKAMIPVHLFGQCAQMDRLADVAARAQLYVIEDAAQALGAASQGRPAGSMGTAGCFSFFPTKNLGGYGDGGLVVTQDQRLAEQIRLLRNHGGGSTGHYRVIGGNFRLDELQAAVLLAKFTHLPAWTQARQERAAYYDGLFTHHGLTDRIDLPLRQSGDSCVFHQYVIRVPWRDRLRAFLTEHQIGTGIYYATPLHRQPCYQSLGYRAGDFPEAERAAQETLALPIYPELQRAQQDYVVEQIKACADRVGGTRSVRRSS